MALASIDLTQDLLNSLLNLFGVAKGTRFRTAVVAGLWLLYMFLLLFLASFLAWPIVRLVELMATAIINLILAVTRRTTLSYLMLLLGFLLFLISGILKVILL